MATTLLSMVQDVLNDLDGDEVSSITDTAESEKVAKHIQTVFNNMMANRNWPHTITPKAIESRSDSNYPSHMILADNVKEIISVYYDKRESGETRRDYKEVKYKRPDDFLRYLAMRNNDNSNIIVVTDDSGVELLIQNDKHPEYFTSFDDTNIIFDSYDSGIDVTLQSSKTQALGYQIFTLDLTDTATINLPNEAIPELKETVITRAQFKERDIQDPISAQESIKQKRWNSRKAWRAGGKTRYPDYGRK